MDAAQVPMISSAELEHVQGETAHKFDGMGSLPHRHARVACTLP